MLTDVLLEISFFVWACAHAIEKPDDKTRFDFYTIWDFKDAGIAAMGACSHRTHPHSQELFGYGDVLCKRIPRR